MAAEPDTDAPALNAIGPSLFRATDPGVRAIVASIAASVSLFVYERLVGFADNLVNGLALFLATVGLFNVVYWTAGWVATSFADRFTNHTRVRGKWFHVLYFDDDGSRNVRHGPVEIKYDASDELHVNGLNLDPNRSDAFHSTWHSKVVGLQDSRLILVFESLAHHRACILGLMVFDLFSTKDGGGVLVGFFQDAGTEGRQGRHGHVRLYQKRKDYQQYLKFVLEQPPHGTL